MTTEEPIRDWVEDFRHENGNYQCKCFHCKNFFMGHKRRVVCRACTINQDKVNEMNNQSKLKRLVDEMANLDELKQLSVELDEYIKRLEEVPKPWPQDGDKVFVLCQSGVIIEPTYAKENSFVAKVLSQGNGFRTIAEAEAEWHYRDVANALSQQEGARRFVKEKDNWCLIWDLDVQDGVGLAVRRAIPEGHFSVYFDKREQVENAIAAVGEKEIIRAIRWKELGLVAQKGK